MQGWLEGYLLTGRHGFFHTYEAFATQWWIPCLTSMPSGWISARTMCPGGGRWSSLEHHAVVPGCGGKDHNGFSHQDPGYIDLVTNKSPDVVRAYFPPDANCLLSVADHCLPAAWNYINVIVSDKQKHLQYLPMDKAIEHCN